MINWARTVHSENFERVSDEHLLLAARHVSLKRVAPGEALFLEGDPGAHFMLVLSGSIVIHVGMPESSQALIFADRERHLQQHDLLSSSFLGERVHEFTTGTGFGEVALTEKGEAMRRSASAIGSESGAEVLQIPAVVYEKSLSNGFGDRRYKRLNALKSIFLFEGWNRARLISLSQRLIDRTFQYGEALLHAGDEWPACSSSRRHRARGRSRSACRACCRGRGADGLRDHRTERAALIAEAENGNPEAVGGASCVA